MTRLGVTGTDTSVGKTVVSCAIVTALRAMGRNVAAMKPVETGGSDDAERLQRAAGDRHLIEQIRPIVLPEPLAPLVAGRRAGVDVDVGILDATFDAFCKTSDVVVVEGAGGLLVPITRTESFATLFKRWDLELVIVSANRLGALNHTLLTVEAARAYGLRIRGVVLNTIHNATPTVSEATNYETLRELLDPLPVYQFPYYANLAEARWPTVAGQSL